MLISGQKHKALTKFGETLELWRQVVNFLRVIENSFNLKFNEIEVNGKKVETANTELYSLLNSIKKAINDEDLVTISDLVEYELRDKFEEQKDICIALQKVIQEQADQLARQMQ